MNGLTRVSKDDVDYYTADGALELAAALKRYWAERGYEVRAEIVELPLGRDKCWTVRTNLEAGLPPAEVSPAEPAADPIAVAREQLALGRSRVEVARLLQNHFGNVPRSVLRAALEDW